MLTKLFIRRAFEYKQKKEKEENFKSFTKFFFFLIVHILKYIKEAINIA